MSHPVQPTRATITSTGRYFPTRCLPNRYFYETLGLETTEEWIRTRTGIRERRIVDHAAGETTSFMAAMAARDCLAKRHLAPEELDCIIVATVTPDLGFPPVACAVQHDIGATNAFAYDVEAACSGFMYCLSTASCMVESGRYRRVLVIGSETMSSILDYADRTTCVLFGDGAGAVLVEARPDGLEGGILDFCMHADGAGIPHLYRTGGGILHHYPGPTKLTKHQYVYQEGSVVFRFAVTNIVAVVRELLQRNEMTPQDVDLFVPHQANTRIIEAARAKVKVPKDRLVLTIDRYANTTSATIPTSLDIALEQGRVHAGDKIVMCSFGGGFTWGSMLLQWSVPTENGHLITDSLDPDNGGPSSGGEPGGGGPRTGS